MVARELVQVTREVDGAVQYAFKTAGVIDPLEFDLVWQVATTPTPAGYEPYMMYRSNRGTRGAVGKGRWGTCTTCTEDFPLNEMVTINGKTYCTKNKCNEDFV